MPIAPAEPHVAQGRELLKVRRDSEALVCFEQARGESPMPSAAIVGQCQALLRLGHVAAARETLDRALRENPSLPGVHGIRAEIFRVEGRPDEAWMEAQRGCSLSWQEPGPGSGPGPGWSAPPADPVAWFVRGILLLERGEADAALTSFDAAIALDPELGAAHQGRASALGQRGRSAEALAAFDAALRSDPCNAGIPTRLGHYLIQLNRLEPAVAAFASALAIDPRQPAALQGQAQCLAALGRAPEAIQAYTRLLALDPDAAYLRGERFHVQLQCCDWVNFEANRDDLAARVRRGERVDNPGSFMTYCDSAADQRRCAQIFAAQIAAEVGVEVGAIDAVPRCPRPAHAPGRLRIAYLSADFHQHATAYLAAGLFEAHDRSRFETFGISFGPDDGSEIRRRVARAFEHFEDVSHLTDRAIAEWLRARHIDIAVDLKGHTLGGRPQIFAHRPAPVQVSFLGYPGTLGAPWMDYLIADRTVVPERERVHYSEQLIYLPGCYQVNDDARQAAARPSRRAAGLPETGFVFCCFNNSYKITPEVFEDWLQILHAVQGSVLWLLASNPTASANLGLRAQEHGINPQRLIFAPWLTAAEHLARCGLADLFLDTQPYNAHTTASDALWSGVPIVTRPGSSFASRVATSLLRAVGLAHLSVDSREDYVRLAIGLAQEPAQIQALKDALAVARRESMLFDTAGYCRRLEQAFETIGARSRRGEAPTLLEVPA
jgi:predicted O-linked N-acetylglucosamine transferase (SPINDLY family)